MANAVVARWQGDDYQARVFWYEACPLFWEKDSKVIKVGFDLDGAHAPKAFDDVSIQYASPMPDGRGGTYTRDYCQVKNHVDHAGAFTCDALIDPSFINGETFSLLERLKVAQEHEAPDGLGVRFRVISFWPIDSNDTLGRLVGNGGEIRLQKLFDGTTDRSEMGQVRKKWRERLKMKTDDELKRVLLPLRIESSFGSLEQLGDRLNDRLHRAGLKTVASNQMSNRYDDVIRKIRASGQAEFARDELKAVCVQEELWQGTPEAEQEDAVQVGLRSFLRWAERMELETQHMLCLVPRFDGRNIQAAGHWHDSVFPRLSEFVEQTMRGECAYHLHIDAHSSIAFAAGYCLDAKSGARVFPVQKTKGKGKVIWDPTPASADCQNADWCCDDHFLESDGEEVALAVCVTHDVTEDVRLYIERELPEVKRILVCRTSPLGANALANGVHADALAQTLANILKKQRSVQERQARLHVFGAAPNALMFFLGQHSRSFGQFTLYEYDFDTSQPGAYQPSLSFPPPVAPQTCD